MKREILFVLLVLVMASLACSTIVVSNTGEVPIIVELTMPDGSFYTRQFETGESQQYTAAKGGTVVARALPDQAFIEKMNSIRDDLVVTMFTQGDANLSRLRAFTALQSSLQALQDTSGLDCSAQVPDKVAEGESSVFYINVTYRDGGSWECGVSQP